MKNKLIQIFAAASMLFISQQLFAQDTTQVKTKPPADHGQHFVDRNGDGYNDYAPDDDGDGIPNGLDPDFKKGKQKGKRHRFIDLDGDGIDDRIQNGNGEMVGMENPTAKPGATQTQSMGEKSQGEMQGTAGNQKRHRGNK